MIVRRTSRLLHSVTLTGCIVLVLPFSFILHESGGSTISRTGMTHSCAAASSTNADDESGKTPAKSCPVMEFRAGLALLSLKSSPKILMDAPATAASVTSMPSLSIPPRTVFRAVPSQSTPKLAFLGVLRI